MSAQKDFMQHETGSLQRRELRCAVLVAQVCEAAIVELEAEQALLQALSEEEREAGDAKTP